MTSSQPVGQRSRGDWGGLILLGWYGSGGETAAAEGNNTDVAGHFAGWASGVLLGGAAAAGIPGRLERRLRG